MQYGRNINGAATGWQGSGHLFCVSAPDTGISMVCGVKSRPGRDAVEPVRLDVGFKSALGTFCLTRRSCRDTMAEDSSLFPDQSTEETWRIVQPISVTPARRAALAHGGQRGARNGESPWRVARADEIAAAGDVRQQAPQAVEVLFATRRRGGTETDGMLTTCPSTRHARGEVWVTRARWRREPVT